MSARRLAEDVRLMLAELEVEHELASDCLARIQYGSADVVVEVSDDPAIVAVRACLLAEVNAAEPDDQLRLLQSLNDLNGRARFGRFSFDRDRREVNLEYEMLGGYLQREELLNALQAVATSADDHDDLLMERLGTGRRASDLVGRPDAPPPF